MKQFILAIVLFSLPILVFSADSRVQKYFENKEYTKILQIIESKKTNELYGAEDYTICGHIAFMYGLYEESCGFYQKVVLISKNSLGEEDLINYAFALIKLGKGNQVLTDPCFKIDANSSSWLVHLRTIASTRDSYVKQKDSLMTINKLRIDFLPQYGLDYFEDQVYYSYSRFPARKRGALPESEMIMDRRAELSGIEAVKVDPNGKSVSPSVLKKSLKGAGRIASVNMVDKGDNFFATVVDRKGGYEQIFVHGNLFPAFSHNSQEYACAMPFFNSADQRLYFCSNMPGGFGGWDIYYSEFKGGEWKYPVNMGSKVNTPFDEFFPSVYKDLLIFSSEAREGKGGFDNYSYSPKTGVVTNLWPLNTTGDDFCLKIIQDKPFKAIGVNVANANFYSSPKALDAILNQKKKKVESVVPVDTLLAPDPEPVVEKAAEPVVEAPKKVVAEQVEQKPAPQPKPLSVKNVKAQEVQTKQLPGPETRDSRNGDVFLGTLHYDLNNSVFKSSHYAVLDSITRKIRAGEFVNIIVWGFTDRCGAEAYNGNLSYQRAIGVVEYLRSKFVGAESKVYFTIAAGEYFADANRQVNANDRRIEVYASPRTLPFTLMYAYKSLPGESMASIAKIFNNKLESLSELNRTTSESRSSSGIFFVGIQGIHVVSPNETIISISQLYRCTVDQILKANHKVSNNVKVAEKLIIPLPISN